ncbi:MAG: nucleoside deaminase [Dehalococcoidia bacterium]
MPEDADLEFLRQAFALAVESVEAGDQGFGALLAAPDGLVLLRAHQTRTRTGDCTSHAETTLVREASIRWPRDLLASSTLYSSTEPCPMCAGSIGWSGIGRVVFGLSQARMYTVWPEAKPRFTAMGLSRLILESLNPPILLAGPLLEDEGLEAHRLWARLHPGE